MFCFKICILTNSTMVCMIAHFVNNLDEDVTLSLGYAPLIMIQSQLYRHLNFHLTDLLMDSGKLNRLFFFDFIRPVVKIVIMSHDQ